MNDTATIRMLLTTAVLAAVAALVAGPAQAFVMDVEGGGGSGAAATVPARGGLDPAIRTAIAARTIQESSLATPQRGTIPYLSHGIGVDETLFSGQPTATATAAQVSSGTDFDWTWVGLGAGGAALLAAAMAGLYLSTRQRSRVALP